jgi:hypothetical protein
MKIDEPAMEKIGPGKKNGRFGEEGRMDTLYFTTI